MPARIGSLRVLSAKQAVTEEVRALIHEGELHFGEKVSIEALALRFGTSRTPVRDALFQLSSEGLVSIEPRVGVYIRAITDQEVVDVYQIKGLLEPLMASWAAERGSLPQREQFHSSLVSLDHAAADGDVAAYVSCVEERRRALVEMANSAALDDTLTVIDGRVRLLRFRNLRQPGRLAQSAAQHRAVADAVRDGDRERAYETMRFHMHDALVRVRRLLQTDAATQRRATAERSRPAEAE
ncbi:MAG: GntR family transcriptional regulator [Candidatus Dormibacter sp.]